MLNAGNLTIIILFLFVFISYPFAGNCDDGGEVAEDGGEDDGGGEDEEEPGQEDARHPGRHRHRPDGETAPHLHHSQTELTADTQAQTSDYIESRLVCGMILT